MAYVYRGTIRDEPEIYAPKRTAKIPLRDFNPDKCGTYAGYRRHIRYQIPVCATCRVAQRAYDREYDKRRNGRSVLGPSIFQPNKCGTTAGYWQHRRYDIDVCPECRDALRAYKNDWKAKKEGQPR